MACCLVISFIAFTKETVIKSGLRVYLSATGHIPTPSMVSSLNRMHVMFCHPRGDDSLRNITGILFTQLQCLFETTPFRQNQYHFEEQNILKQQNKVSSVLVLLVILLPSSLNGLRD